MPMKRPRIHFGSSAPPGVPGEDRGVPGVAGGARGVVVPGDVLRTFSGTAIRAEPTAVTCMLFCAERKQRNSSSGKASLNSRQLRA